MTTQVYREPTPSRWRNQDVVALGIVAGEIVGLLWLVLTITGRLNSGTNPALSLGAFWQWLPSGIRQLTAGEVARMGLPLTADTPAFWYLSRGAGLVSYMLLWAATVWGLVTRTKVAKGMIAAPFAANLHEFLSLAALGFAGLHGLVLLGDHYLHFSVGNVIYPFASSYRPGWVGMGQLGFYLGIVVVLSFYLRKSLGPRTWRVLHYFSFLCYGLVVVHGVTSGTDTSALAVQVMYVVTASAVVFLVYYRFLTSWVKA
jgi:DMSO/TMAO reductase YedYZ heme-binding membrane subunit